MSAQKSFQINPRYRLQWEEAQGCHVLLYPEGLVKLGDSAYLILQHCQTSTTEQALITKLQQQFPDAQGLGDDVREFLQHARAREWLVDAE